MPERKRPTILDTSKLQADALQFDLQAEMLPLLQRVSGNRSKRTAKTLVKEGPLRVVLLALEKGGNLEEHAVAGPFSIQCLLGKADVTMGKTRKRLATGDLLVVDAGVAHNVDAVEASILLLTITAGRR
ncbi:MAG: cupin domain-containing protein [Dehalococcoidia bacterium]